MSPPRRAWSNVLATLCLLVLLPGVAIADDAGMEEARKHFKAGVAYLEDPDGARFEEAYRAFKKAYEVSHSPKVLGNLALAAMKLERDGEAIEAYTRYLKEVDDIDPQERAQCERDLATLVASAVKVRVRIDVRTKRPPAALTLVDSRLPVQGNPVVNVHTPGKDTTDLVLRSGHHVLTVKDASRDLGQWDFVATPGGTLSHVFVLEDPPPAASPPTQEAPSRAAPLVVTGIGVTALIAGGVMGIVTLGKVNRLEDDCPNDACVDPAYQSEVGSTRNFVRATDFLLLGGGVVTGVGLIWLIAASTSSSSKEPARAGVRVTPACGPHGCMGSMHGRF